MRAMTTYWPGKGEKANSRWYSILATWTAYGVSASMKQCSVFWELGKSDRIVVVV